MAHFKYGRNEAKVILKSQFNFWLPTLSKINSEKTSFKIATINTKFAMRLVKDFDPIAITVLCEYVYWNFRGEELAIIVWIFFRYMLIIHNAENLLEEFLGWFLRSTAKMIATCHSIQKWVGIIGYAAKNLQGPSKNNVRLKEKKSKLPESSNL